MNTTEFLEAIFDDAINTQQQLSIFSLPDKAIRRFASIDKAVPYATQRAKTQNVYFGLGLIKGNPQGRGKLADIAGIGCLWADIDIANSEHKKENLPPDIETARKLLSKIPLTPSIIVSTGGGLHVYWVFKEAWVFEDEGEKQRACALSRRLSGTLRNAASELGYDLDSVGDLTRILRLPGTLNQKYEPPFEVRVLTTDKRQYTPYDFENVLLAEEFCAIDQTIEVHDVVLQAEAQPPIMKFMALLDNDSKFKKTWGHKRPDLQDQSPSGYDLSAASIAVGAGWSDQEIASLIVFRRREQGDDLQKALRWDYIKRLIVKARTSQQIAQIRQDQAEDDEQQEQAIKQLATVAATAEQTPDKRAIVLQGVSKTIGLPITRWLQHGRENARYSLLLGDDRWIRMGSANEVISARIFRTKLYEATGHLIKSWKLKSQIWDDVCKLLASVIEIVENEETTSAYQAQQWVESYLLDHTPWKEDDWQKAAHVNEPFIKDELLHVHAPELRKHMKMIQQESGVAHANLCECLRISGFTRTMVTLWHEGKAWTRSYWAKQIKPNTLKEKKTEPIKKKKKTQTELLGY